MKNLRYLRESCFGNLPGSWLRGTKTAPKLCDQVRLVVQMFGAGFPGWALGVGAHYKLRPARLVLFRICVQHTGGGLATRLTRHESDG